MNFEKKYFMDKNYYNSDDLKKFGNVGEFQKNLADKFFD